MRIFNAIKQAFINLVDEDTSAYPRGQAGYSSKATNFVRLSPYGLDSNPPEGAFCLLISSQGKESGKFGISSDFLRRFKELKEGEVAVYNTLTESFVLLKEDGNIAIEAKGGLVEISGEVVVSGVVTAADFITA